MMQKQVVEAMAEAVANLLKDREAKDLEIMKSFSDRLSLLEQAKTMHFESTHDPDKAYAAGAVVQRSGMTWVALTATSETPGSSSHWRCLGKDRP